MKKLVIVLLLFSIVVSCEKDDSEGIAPELPPVETMAIDFTKFGSANKSTSQLRSNWLYAAKTVGVWNVIIGTTFAVPVAAFKLAINHQPEKLNNLTWQWQYTVDGFTSQYSARLTGKLETAHVKWEMYVAKEGVDSFEEFLWFEGTSNTDGKSGQWILHHSSAFPEETIQIDWKKEDVVVGEIMYTYIRELNNQRQADEFKGSTLTYGLQDAPFDIYVNVHAFNSQSQTFNDSYIEWNKTSYAGHVKAEHYFNNTSWYCWDTQGYDTDCD
jgi:hypothetical protein